MTAIKAYLLRLILCGFLNALAAALIRGRKGARTVALCGGCLLILTALRPLLQVDLSRLPDLVTGMTYSQRQQAAAERNDALLRELVEEQTSQWIEARAAELDLHVECTVAAEPGEGGSFIPASVELVGVWTEGQRQSLSRLLAEQLEIPPERQRWVGR